MLRILRRAPARVSLRGARGLAAAGGPLGEWFARQHLRVRLAGSAGLTLVATADVHKP